MLALVIALGWGALLVQPGQAPQAKTDALFVQPVVPEALTETQLDPEMEPVVVDSTENPQVQTTTFIPENRPIILPTQAQFINYDKDTPILYYAQSGDSLAVLAVRFGVEVSEITSTNTLPEEGFIPEGQLLLIPARLESTSSALKLFPDSELVNSPSALGFDVDEYVQRAEGFLSTYSESVYSKGILSGAEIIKSVSMEFSIHPRILLALLEYQSGWVFGTPSSLEAETYPMRLFESGQSGLYKQLVLASGMLGTGYYGWREGTIVALNFPDGMVLRLASELNCGTVGLMYYFSKTMNLEDWANSLYSSNRFIFTYENMFGNPWITAQQFEPLFTPDVLQPEMILPFEVGVTWSFTSGPHAAWGAAEVRAALDFAPPGDAPGCIPTGEWVVASAPGLVVRSETGVVVEDLDGDGNEQTGWNIIYLHIGTTGRVEEGTWLEAGSRIGHPSCEGGISTGTHLHIARKYNGEWVPAEGPLSFVLSGWRAKAGSVVYSGWLIKDGQIIKSSRYGTSASHLMR